jgi:hypothetical protein
LQQPIIDAQPVEKRLNAVQTVRGCEERRMEQKNEKEEGTK